MITSESFVSKPFTEVAVASAEEQKTVASKVPLRITVACRCVAYFVTCSGAVLIAYMLQLHSRYADYYPLHKLLAVCGSAGLFAVLFRRRDEARRASSSFRSICETAAAMRVSTLSLFLIICMALVLRIDLSLGAVALTFLIMPSLVLFQEYMLASVIQKMLPVFLTRSSRPAKGHVRILVVAGHEKSPFRHPLMQEDPRQGYVLQRREQLISIPWHYSYVKRVIDVILASTLLLLLLPALVLLAVLVRMSSPGPAFFVQRRVGRNGAHFDMYKFRSMSCHTRRYARSPVIPSDPRITKIGRFLRLTSLDELPQLLNILKGDMSLVGPRPEMPFIVRQYSVYQRQRLQVVPGLTGLWQLSPDRVSPIHENLHHDLAYIQNRSIWMDLAILIHTPFFAMRGGI